MTFNTAFWDDGTPKSCRNAFDWQHAPGRKKAIKPRKKTGPKLSKTMQSVIALETATERKARLLKPMPNVYLGAYSGCANALKGR